MSFFSSCNKIVTERKKKIKYSIYANGQNDKKIVTQTYAGVLLNSVSDSIQGYGHATILLKDGLAIIDFTVVITTAGSHESDFTYGINRDFLNATVGKVIQPITGGRLDYYDSNGVLQSGTDTVGGYGGTPYTHPTSQFWTLARVYNTTGEIGSWPSNKWTVGSTIKGTVYGTYSV